MVNLYRKYRPRKFSELKGQNGIKDILISELKNNKISHAYLFTGMRGCGKTTTARLLAKSLNCLSPVESYEPCGKCNNCKAIDVGSFPDVVEMDAASNRGIDEIRSIKEGVNFVPVLGKYKVYIIDEVHMLTQQAFNALLKTLEEPPQHTVFILATTEINKVPQTIISRCQVLSFKPHNIEDVVENLIEISEKERYSYEKEALTLIAKKGEGSMRDAIGILEQVAIFSRSNITKQHVLDLLGDVEDAIIDDFINYLLSNDRNSIERLLDKVYMSGKNMEIFLKDLIYRLNERIENGEKLYKLLSFFVNAYKDILYFFDKKIFLKAKSFELMDMISLSDFLIQENTPIKNQNLSTIPVKSFSKPKTVQASSQNKEPKVKTNSLHSNGANDREESVGQSENDGKGYKYKQNHESTTKELEINNDKIPDFWEKLMLELKTDNIALYTLISKSIPKFEDDKVILKYPSTETFSYETVSSKLSDIKNLLKKYGFDKGISVIKGEEIVADLPKEIKNILKLFGGSIERQRQ